MVESKPRYEFRIWAKDLAPLAAKLARLAGPDTAATTSKETYLVSRATNRCSAKVRAAIMDVKILLDEDRGLERWKPVLKAGFPLDRAVIATEIFPHLEIEPPALRRPRYSMAELFEEVARAETRIAIVDLAKTRHRFSLDTVQAEHALVALDDVTRDTVAVESVDPDAVLRAIEALGIGGERNTSYVRYIKQTLGIPASSM